ncbi:hypothetical protein F0U62_18660 [Cystobacter fuscus]|uniref:hypothetical protein n=1 Tax=Cystobacter fuscus TaxID=43 RepID=UPI002B30EB1D|nr:hypothetical protein F0U62_18660 [Cystobacter fuscus]
MESQLSKQRQGIPVPEDLLIQLRALVTSRGEALARERVGIAASTMGRALAGLTVSRGTVAMIRAGLATPTGDQ